MAERRMFAKTIIDSDVFLEMPHTTQLLYFHLSIRADDDGFINNPKNIMRLVACKEDDIKLLITKQFIIPFESGIVVIKHWKIHNYIQKDRYTETNCKLEKSQLNLENKVYEKQCIQNGYNMDTQVRLGKDSLELDKASIDKPPAEEKTAKIHFAEFVTMTNSEYENLVTTHGKPIADQCITVLDNYKGSTGKKYKCDYRAILSWVLEKVKKGGTYGTSNGNIKTNEFTTKDGKTYDSCGNEII